MGFVRSFPRLRRFDKCKKDLKLLSHLLGKLNRCSTRIPRLEVCENDCLGLGEEGEVKTFFVLLLFVLSHEGNFNNGCVTENFMTRIQLPSSLSNSFLLAKCSLLHDPTELMAKEFRSILPE